MLFNKNGCRELKGTPVLKGDTFIIRNTPLSVSYRNFIAILTKLIVKGLNRSYNKQLKMQNGFLKRSVRNEYSSADHNG